MRVRFLVAPMLLGLIAAGCGSVPHQATASQGHARAAIVSSKIQPSTPKTPPLDLPATPANTVPVTCNTKVAASSNSPYMLTATQAVWALVMHDTPQTLANLQPGGYYPGGFADQEVLGAGRSSFLLSDNMLPGVWNGPGNGTWWCLMPAGGSADAPRIEGLLSLSPSRLSSVTGSALLADMRSVMQDIVEQQIVCGALATNPGVGEACTALSPNPAVLATVPSASGSGPSHWIIMQATFRKSGDARWSDVVMEVSAGASGGNVERILFADPSPSYAAKLYCPTTSGNAYCAAAQGAQTANDLKYGAAAQSFLDSGQ